MYKRILVFSIGLLNIVAALFGQQADVSALGSDDSILKNLPRMTMPSGYATRPLPTKKDNSRVIYFSGIYNQDVWNCNQAASIWTMFTYEINYLRNLNSSLTQNQYSPMAVYNLLNYGNGSNGVSYFDSWNLIKSNGIPGNPDFTAYSQNSQIWMTGYDKYYRGMKNRVDQVFAIDVGNPDGLLILKHWINDHLDGSQIGGVANYQIGSGGMDIPQIPLDKGLEEEGQCIVIKYGPIVGHAMTFVGWNDSVRYDVNADGRYTNNIDINGDGVVNMKDWEIGAMLVVNSWGAAYNAGKLWVMYRLLAEKVIDGGIWNNAAMVVKPKKTYDPLLTIKAKIRYNQRNRIKIQVGVSSDLNAHDPGRVIDYPCFNFQGDVLPMQGFSGVDSDLIEIGLDITPLMNYIPANGQAKIFLDVIQKSPDATASGKVESFSVLDYTNGINEFINTEGAVTILPNSVTRLSVPINTRVNRPSIITEELTDAQVGMEYRSQIEADGTTGPYRYENPATWFVEKPIAESFDFAGGNEVFTEPLKTARVMDLPFSFPLFGKSYDQVTVLADGGIVMGQSLVIYPYVIDPRLRFYQNCGIFPLLGTLYYSKPGSSVTMEVASDAAIFRWHAAVDPEGLKRVEFAAKIQSDGTIQFYYGNVNITPDIFWISGISKGNNLDYLLMDQNFSGVKNDVAFGLELMEWPSWLSLGSNGDLRGIPDKTGLFTLPLKVTDWSGISNYKELSIKVNGGSSVQTINQEGGTRIWPNPFTNRLWLEGYCEQAGNLTFTVYDLSGRELLARKYTAQAGHNTIHCTDLAGLNSGVYLFQLAGVLNAQGKLVKN
ncbi:MAG: T9SS type A sorting domain-containing protein [Bacteroidia bacterium]|nr:T9SS type A sorting domain-containing protein [Bacteroidia bacterium]